MQISTNPQQEVLIRKLTPEDLGKIAVLHSKVFPDYFLTRMGQDFLQYYYGEYLDNPDHYAYVADSQGKLVGFVAGSQNPNQLYNTLYKKRFFSLALIVIKRLLQDQSLRQAVYERRTHVTRAFKALFKPRTQVTPPSGPSQKVALSTILAIGVDPDAQGTGIAVKLLQSFIEETEQRNVHQIGLTVLPDNLRALSFYLKSGFGIIRKDHKAIYLIRKK